MPLKQIMLMVLRNYSNGKIRKQLVYSVYGCLLFLLLVYLLKDTSSASNIDSARQSELQVKKSSLAILVLSHRNAFDRRETIRRTWALDHKHVYFVVSELYCQYPHEHRQGGSCSPNNKSITKELIQDYIDKEEGITAKLRNESNVVLLPVTDVFNEFPDLMKESFNWGVRNLDAKWFLHVEDSFNVHVNTFENYLVSNLDSNENIIMMLMIQCTRSVKQTSRPKYLVPYQCALNHVVSRQVAEYLISGLTDIFEYRDNGISTSLQVLASPHIKSAHREEFGMMTINGAFSYTAGLVLDVCIEYKMNACVDNTTFTLYENPSDYLHSDRFDVVVKMVYAYFYVFEKQIPNVISEAYLEHLHVWNNFRETCSMKEIWFDSKITCKEKESSSDFISSFHKTLENVKKIGFNPNISRIPVDKNGFINNGAHRLASSVVLSKKASFEHHTYHQNSRWGYKHFKNLGMSNKTFDLVMLEWMKIQLKLPELNTLVFIVTVFSNDKGKDESMRKIVKERCSKDNGILYEKYVDVTKDGARQLITHMYGQQPWLETKVHQMISRFSGKTERVLFLFVYTKRSTDLVKCKYEIRKLYNDKIFKSTAHIPDSVQENLILAEMILNPNSIRFLNYAKNAADCNLIAKEIGSRSKDAPIKTLPGIYSGRDDIMIDSGTVLGLFDLRRRTDVDLLFLHDIDKSILGHRHGISIQAHAFKYNFISKERAWGEDHFSKLVTKNQWDLFYDPQNYGYCYGIKFVSMEQLVRYKTQRNEPNKDSYDVDLINAFLDTIPNSCQNPHGNAIVLSILYVLVFFCLIF